MLCCPHTSTRSHPLEHGQPTRTTSLKETDSSPRSPRQFKAHQASSWPHECPPHLLTLTNLILCMFCSGSCSCCEITSQKSCHVQKMLLDSSSLSLTMFLTPFCDAPWALGKGMWYPCPICGWVFCCQPHHLVLYISEACNGGTPNGQLGGLQSPAGKLAADGELPALSFGSFNKPQTQHCLLQALTVSPNSAVAHILPVFTTTPGHVLFVFLYLRQIL